MYYIAGFVVNKVSKKVKCTECLNLLTTDSTDLSSYTHFTDFISEGKLVRVSVEVFKIIQFIYKLVDIQSDRNLNTQKVLIQTSSHFKDLIFKNHPANGLDEVNHRVMLIKAIGSLFLKVIGHHKAREATSASNLPNLGLRQKLTKLILFRNV